MAGFYFLRQEHQRKTREREGEKKKWREKKKDKRERGKVGETTMGQDHSSGTASVGVCFPKDLYPLRTLRFHVGRWSNLIIILASSCSMSMFVVRLKY